MTACAHAEARVHPRCHVGLENIQTIWDVVSFEKTKQNKTKQKKKQKEVTESSLNKNKCI